MEIILLTDINNLGESGDIISVKSGFARNKLIPQGLALRASKKNIAIASERKKSLAAKIVRNYFLFCYNPNRHFYFSSFFAIYLNNNCTLVIF